MTHVQAKERLKEMGCITENPTTRWFRVESPPKDKRGIALFVCCVKSLGAYSVALDGKPSPVELSCGDISDEVLFRIRHE